MAEEEEPVRKVKNAPKEKPKVEEGAESQTQTQSGGDGQTKEHGPEGPKGGW